MVIKFIVILGFLLNFSNLALSETDWITIVNDYFDKKFPKHCMFMQICSSTSQLGVALLLSKKQQLDTGMPGPICFGLLFFKFLF